MTASRVPSLFAIAALFAWGGKGSDTLAFIVFFLAAITDFFDGWLARRMGIVSNFGKLMDALTDKILNIGMMIFLLVYPTSAPLLPSWCVFLVVIVLVRELLITGLRLVAASCDLVLSAERSGKIKTVLQIFAIGLFLFVRALETDFGFSPAIIENARLGALFAFSLATVLTVTSGVGYLIKYWHVFMSEPPPSPRGKS
ncbi:MAG: CDP-alcohol phosphatidyltransferase family protein [Puniceicoccales bacterium]|jgi:CDP-diacylglycerol--glycerol-3-phosphate 3-phosphatidyltransferase|nr:CDP-alcohol phosphatidyltransferase family protein [Puniceicoccales bacterium]